MTGIVSVNDGPNITVSDFKGNPMWIPTRIIDKTRDTAIEEVLLRNAGRNANGLVAYSESSPAYVAEDPSDLVEFEEIPVVAGQRGLPRIAVANRKGFGVRISKDMFDEGRLDEVNLQVRQVINSVTRNRTRALRAALNGAGGIPEIPAGAAWDTASGRPRRDLANAMEEIASASLTPSNDEEDEFDFAADTVVFPNSIVPVLMDNDNFIDVYKDSLSPQDIRYTGKLEKDVMGMLALQSRHFSPDRVLVVERGTVGFYSDTRELQSTELYPEGNGPNGGPTESWRSDTTYKRVNGIDQPLAACWITGVRTP